MSQAEEGPATHGEQPRGIAAEFFDRGRMLLFVGVLVAELVIFVTGVATPLSNSAQQSLVNETNSQFAGFQSASPVQLVVFVFTHNLFIALAEMIPVAGAFLFVFSVYTTGLAAQVIVVSKGFPAEAAAILFAFPYSIVEFSAYALAVAAGIMLLASWRRRRFRRELRVFVLEAMLVAFVLIIAAGMETVTGISPLIGFALWLPTGAAVAGIILFARRRR